MGATQSEMVEVCAVAFQQLGLSCSIGKIYGSIYVSERPLAFSEIVAVLGLSKGSVSQGLHFLRDLGAIKPVEVTDDRREHFVAETELRRLLAGILQKRVRDPLRMGRERLRLLRRRLTSSGAIDRDFLEQRLDSLELWHRKALFALPLIQRFLDPNDS
jgi:DNA-binding transcriptional regulator GbsR (MarR family)